MSDNESREHERTRLAEALAPLFGNLLEDHLSEIEDRTERIEMQAGEVLLRQGERSDSLYIVLHGRLLTEITDSLGATRKLGEVASGEIVGEESLLTGDPHSATVSALRDSVLVRFPHSTFVEFVHTHPTVIWAITRLVIRRMKSTRDGIEQRAQVRIIAVQFLHRGIDEAAFLDRLGAALRAHGPTRVVDSSVGTHDADAQQEELRLAHWLDEMERSNRFILLVLDDETSVWSKICVRQADRLLLVGSFDGDPGIRPVEQSLLDEMPESARASTSLVVLHENDDPEPTNSSAWIKDRKLIRFHHLHRERQADFERVARFLSHKAIGLVLAGGGAKAFVHLGVYQALEEARIPIDMVGGTSMGSLISAGIAKGWNAERLLQQSREAFTGRNPIGDFSPFPIISMMQGRRMRKLIQEYFGMGNIEDLWLPFFCISGNFTAGEMCVHRQGPLWRSLSASVSLPGILPPTVHDGQLHVDGGTFDNFPVRPMREIGAGKIIACDIEHPRRIQLGYDETPSAWRFFWERYVKRNRRLKVPHAMTTMFRSSFLASYERRREAATLADLYFCSPSNRVGLTQWKALDRAHAAGYAYAKRRLDEVGEDALRELGIHTEDE